MIFDHIVRILVRFNEGLQRSHIASQVQSDVTSTASLCSKIVSQHDQISLKEHAL